MSVTKDKFYNCTIFFWIVVVRTLLFWTDKENLSGPFKQNNHQICSFMAAIN